MPKTAHKLRNGFLQINLKFVYNNTFCCTLGCTGESLNMHVFIRHYTEWSQMKIRLLQMNPHHTKWWGLGLHWKWWIGSLGCEIAMHAHGVGCKLQNKLPIGLCNLKFTIWRSIIPILTNSKINDSTVIDNRLIIDNSNPQSKIQKSVVQILTNI